jgi:hypothetical protein
MNTDKAEQIKANATINSERPKVGDLCTVRGLSCKIVKVHPFGTIDVHAIEKNKAFRVSGLAFI